MLSYIKYFLAAAALTLLPVFALGLYIGPLQGDLTRLGDLAERDFGPTLAQPDVAILPNDGAVPPDVLVIGDSFSAGNVWESVAARGTGFNFLTFKWEYGSCFATWIASLKRSYPKARYLLVETIEREFLPRFETLHDNCAVKDPILVKVEHPESSRRKLSMPDPSYALMATLNHFRAFDETTASGDTFIAPLSRSDLFSSQRPDQLLYYRDDSFKRAWSAERLAKAIDNLKRIQDMAASAGLAFIVAVVPDKSTAYAPFVKDHATLSPALDIWNAIDARGVTQANWRDKLLPAVTAGQDLYLPNNTHVGNRGYAMMGDVVAERLKRLEGE